MHSFPNGGNFTEFQIDPNTISYVYVYVLLCVCEGICAIDVLRQSVPIRLNPHNKHTHTHIDAIAKICNRSHATSMYVYTSLRKIVSCISAVFSAHTLSLWLSLCSCVCLLRLFPCLKLSEREMKNQQTNKQTWAHFMWKETYSFQQRRCKRYLFRVKKKRSNNNNIVYIKVKMVFRPKMWNCFRVSMDSMLLCYKQTHKCYHLKMNSHTWHSLLCSQMREIQSISRSFN